MSLSNSFTQGKILSPLLRFSLPVFLALFLQAMYGGVDLIVVGQFSDSAGVSAVSTGSQIMMTVSGFVSGLTMGATILLGQKIGQKNDEDAGRVVGTSLLFFALMGLVLGILLAVTARPLVALMQVPIEAVDKTVHYILICSGGILPIVGYNAISAIFRGMGNSKAPLLFVAIACVIHIIVALLFVGGFKLGPEGAALATVLSQTASVVISLVIIKRRGFPFPFGRRQLRLHRETALAILKFGSPIALQDILTNISFLVIIAIVNSLGVVASAGAGIGEKVCVFIMLIPMAFTSSLSAFVAHNVGAGEQLRAKKAMTYGMVTSAAVGVVMFLLTFFRGDLLAGLFSREPDIISAAADYLKAYALDCPLVAILFCALGYCNGNGKTLFTMLQGVICAFCIRIPVAFLMSRLPEVTLFRVGLATPVTTVVGIVICLVYLKLSKWNKEELLVTAPTRGQ